MAGAAARALQYEYKAVGVNLMYEKLKAVVNVNTGIAKFCLFYYLNFTTIKDHIKH